MTQRFVVDFYALTDAGIARQAAPNQDTIFAQQGVQPAPTGVTPPEWSLFVVADGMGGHANGQEASQRAASALADYVIPIVQGGERDPQALAHLMVEGVQEANQAVVWLNEEQGVDSGTTITAALLVGEAAYVVNVGDSRTYLYRAAEGGLRKITTDHSMVQRLLNAGLITPDEVYTHPKRNQVYRGLGDSAPLTVDQFTVTLQPGDKLLLCSDGLWEMVRDPQIQATLAQTSDPQDAAKQLVSTANANGGADNISAIVAVILPHLGNAPAQRMELPRSAPLSVTPRAMSVTRSILMPVAALLAWWCVFVWGLVLALDAKMTVLAEALIDLLMGSDTPGGEESPVPVLVVSNLMGDVSLVYHNPYSGCVQTR